MTSDSASLLAEAPAHSTRELIITRRIEAPRERVYRAWTQRFSEWWGPHGMTTPFYEMDLRPGGVFRTLMLAPDGTEYPTRGIFLEVVPPARIVFTDAFDTEWRPSEDLFFTAIIAFDALPGDCTQLTARALHWTAEQCARHEAMGFHQGWGESFDRLAIVALNA